ncbi:MAG: hypothetical protein FWC86_06650 [Coriobacteriia bacterium]|nr:hypothetical protein [Coriobacteriia bacterium]
MNKYFSKLTLALAVALVASFGVALPAMAASSQEVTQTPPNVAITKVLDIPEGTTVPDSTFRFTFTQMSEIATNTFAETPTPTASINPITVSFGLDNSPNGLVSTDTPPLPIAQATNILALDRIDFPTAGIFHFLIVEDVAGSTQFTAPEFMTYSDAAYIMVVRVSNVNFGTAENPDWRRVPQQLEVAPAVLGTDGSYTWNPDTKTDDYQPGTPGQDGVLRYPSSIRFVNAFIRDIIPPVGDPAALSISKSIVGSDSDFTEVFSFDTTLVIPAAARARLAGESAPGVPNTTFEVSAVVTGTPEPDSTAPAAGTEVVFVVDTATGIATRSFTLGNGQALEFRSLPAGTTFETTERQLENWDGSVSIALGAATPVTVTEDAGEDVATGVRIVSDDRADSAPYAFLGNSADFTNNYNLPPWTGLVISSMPFLAVLLGAALLLALMVASRSRKRIEHLPVAH